MKILIIELSNIELKLYFITLHLSTYIYIFLLLTLCLSARSAFCSGVNGARTEWTMFRKESSSKQKIRSILRPIVISFVQINVRY